MKYKIKVYARERQHNETHKVFELLDQNNNTKKDTNSRSRGKFIVFYMRTKNKTKYNKKL
jgi:hypothetical protein